MGWWRWKGLGERGGERSGGEKREKREKRAKK